MDKLSSKSGQVTIFIILGIVLLIVVGILIYVANQSKTTAPQPERTSVSSQFEPLQQYVESCMQSVGHEGIVQLGIHGGYIDPNDPYISGGTFSSDPNAPYNSDGAYLSPSDSSTLVPYWYYAQSQGSCFNCQMMSAAPTIISMEQQLSRYVGEHIVDCLNNFTTFKSEGYDINAPQTMDVNTTIRDNDVLFEATFPLNASIKGSSAVIDRYYTTDNVPLMKYYLMALNMTANEFNIGYLENLNTFLIYSYGGLSSSMFPPVYATNDGFLVYYWSKTIVAQQYKQLLESYIPQFQVPQTSRYTPIDLSNMSAYEKGFYNAMILDFFNKSMPNTTIDFVFPSSENIYLNIAPSQGDIVGPKIDSQQGVSYLPPSQVNDYQYYYDISYPIFVDIRDEYIPGKYYSFIFSLESNTHQNVGLRDWINGTGRPIYWEKGAAVRQFDNSFIGSNVSYNGKDYEYKQRTSSTLFCDPSQYISGNISLNTFDQSSNTPLGDVSVTFGCGSYASCLIGQTVLNITTKSALFNGQAPICQNGYIQLDKAGYFEKKIALSTKIGAPYFIGKVYLDPIVSINTTIEKYVMQYPVNNNGLFIANANPYLNKTSVPIAATDTAIITLERIPDNQLDTQFAQTIVIGLNASNESNNIMLVPGRYTVTGQLIDYTGFTIPKECEEICTSSLPIIGCTAYTKIPSENINMIPAMWGGVNFDSNHTIFITSSDLSSDKTLHLYVLRMANPPCIDALQSGASAIPYYTLKYQYYLMPRFS